MHSPPTRSKSNAYPEKASVVPKIVFPVHQRLRRFEFHPRTFENGGDYEIRAIKIFGNIFHGSYHFDVIAFQIVFQRFEPFAYNQDLCVYMRSDMLNEPPDTVLIQEKKDCRQKFREAFVPGVR